MLSGYNSIRSTSINLDSKGINLYTICYNVTADQVWHPCDNKQCVKTCNVIYNNCNYKIHDTLQQQIYRLLVFLMIKQYPSSGQPIQLFTSSFLALWWMNYQPANDMQNKNKISWDKGRYIHIERDSKINVLN